MAALILSGIPTQGETALPACAVDLGSRRFVIFPQRQPLDSDVFLFGNRQLRSVRQNYEKAANLPHIGGIEQVTRMYAKKNAGVVALKIRQLQKNQPFLRKRLVFLYNSVLF